MPARQKPPNLTGYTYPVRIRRLSITNVVFSFMRLAIARRKKDAVSPCSALFCSKERSSIPHGCQAPFHQKYEKFSSHVPACQRGFLTPAREQKIRLYYSKPGADFNGFFSNFPGQETAIKHSFSPKSTGTGCNNSMN